MQSCTHNTLNKLDSGNHDWIKIKILHRKKNNVINRPEKMLIFVAEASLETIHFNQPTPCYNLLLQLPTYEHLQ